MIQEIKDRLLYARGILSQEQAYKGPYLLEVHVTNACNLNCIGCSFHSSAMSRQWSPEWSQQCISKDHFFKIIDEAAQMGVRQIVLSGYGEPFMHPEILSFIRHVKEARMKCVVITNGSLLDIKTLDALSLLRLDLLILSLWDHDEKRYHELRPGHAQELEKIKRVLGHYGEKRNEFPNIELRFVLGRRNYDKISEMIEFSKGNGVRRISFKLLRIDKESRDLMESFLLSRDQILAIIKRLRASAHSLEKKTVVQNYFCEFLEDIEVKEGLYQNLLLKKSPCYVGWFYMGVLLNGDVFPCCGGKEYILGNVFQDSFASIWNSDRYRRFREHALKKNELQKSRRCRCEMCANHYINLRVGRLFNLFVSFGRRRR